VDLIAADLGDEDDTFSGMIYTLPVGVTGGSGNDNLYGGSLDDTLPRGRRSGHLDGRPRKRSSRLGPGPDGMSGGDLPGYPATHGFDLVDYSDRVASLTVTFDGRTDDGEAGGGRQARPEGATMSPRTLTTSTAPPDLTSSSAATSPIGSTERMAGHN
jgi:hypothetical protein